MHRILKHLRSSGPDAGAYWERPRQTPSRHLNLSLFLSCRLDAPGVAGEQETGVTLSEKLFVCVHVCAYVHCVCAPGPVRGVCMCACVCCVHVCARVHTCVYMCVGALPVVSSGGDGVVVN